METLGIFDHIKVLMRGNYSLAMDIYLASTRETKAVTGGCASNSAVNEFNSEYSVLKNSRLITFIPADAKSRLISNINRFLEEDESMCAIPAGAKNHLMSNINRLLYEDKTGLFLKNHLRDYICKQVKRLLNESLNEDILDTEEYNKLQENRVNAIYKAMNYSTKTNKSTKSVNIDEINYTKKYTDLINKVIAKAAVEVYNDSHSSVASLSKLKSQDSKAERYGYANAFERSLGVHFSALRVLDVYNQIVEKGNEVPTDISNTLKRELLRYWYNYLLKPFTTNKTEEEKARIKEIINNGGVGLGKVLDTIVDKSNLVANNYLSVIKEVTESEEAFNAYYDEVLTDPALKNVCSVLARDSEYNQNTEEEIRNEEANENTEEEANENPSEDKDTTDENNDPDIGEGMISYDHSGRYNNYMKHVSQRLYNYFAALPIQNSLKEGDYKTDNSYGIPENMNPTNCIATLIGYCNSVSVKGMIQDIRNIANEFTGYASFNKLANDLEKDPDFAFELLTTLSKTVIDRLALTTKGGPVFTGKVINPNVNPTHVLHYLIYNEVKDYYRRNDVEGLLEHISAFDDKIKKIKFKKRFKESDLSEQEIKDINKELNYRIDDLVKIIREIVPSIDKKAILNYIQYNNASEIEAEGDIEHKRLNITRLIDIVQKMSKHMATGRALYINAQKDAYVRRTLRKNRQLNNIETDATANYNVESYATDYVWGDNDEVLTDSKLLRDALLPYYTVRLEFNSRDINGHLKSSIMNNSLLTTLNKLIKPGNEQALIEYGQRKLRSKQYLKSSILFDQYDSNGDKISGGLFHINPDGSLTINEYNKQYFNFKLFEGASNQLSVKSISYDKMTTADYLPSVVNMFNGEVNLENKHDDYYGTYFLPIPSDAKNTFTVKGAKYSIGRQVDEKLLEDSANAYVNALIGKDIDQIQAINRPEENGIASINYNNKHAYLYLALNNKPLSIDNKKAIYVTNPEEIKKRNEGKPFKAAVFFELGNKYSKVKQAPVGDKTYIDEEGELQTTNAQLVNLEGEKTEYIILTGIVNEINGDYVLTNHNIAGVSSEAKYAPTAKDIVVEKPDGKYSPKVTYSGYALSEIYYAAKNYAKKQLLKGDVTVNGVTIKKVPTTINRNSQAFKILKNNFKQEIINAANAYDHYFKWKTLDNRAGYTIMLEKDKSGIGKPVFRDDVDPTKGYKFYHLDEDGKVLSKTENGYTCKGKAFNTDKFTLTVKDEKGNLVNKNFLAKVIGNDSAREKDTDKIDFFYGGGIVLVANMDAETGHLDIRDVNFTDKQNALIDKCLEEYIIALGQQGDAAIEENRSLNEDNLSQYYDNEGVKTTGFDIAVNYAIQLMAFDDILTGEGKFYKDAQTRLKRAKEYQASGTPYGLANFEAGFEPNLEDYDGESFLNNGSYERTNYEVKFDKAHNREIIVPVRDEETGEIETETVKVRDVFDKSDLLRGVTQRNGFVGVTIANTKKTSKQLNALVDKLVENGLDKYSAMDLLFGPRERDSKTNEYKKDKDGNFIRRGGFTETKVNDAQSYITFQEWVRRIAARGKLKRYMPLIESIINYENLRKTTDYYDIAQVRKLQRARPSATMLKEFVQVQKNIYYDLYYDERYGLEVPRQIKNAEFVLIPFMIEGTELEQVYNMMQEAGIDQLNTVETSKAANETITTLWDNNGDINGITGVEDAEAVKAKVSEYAAILAQNKQLFSYNNLYTQQETPQHANATNKFSLQISKKIIDNIQPGNELYDDKLEYLDLVNQQIRDSCRTLLNRFNIPMDEHGNIDLEAFNKVDKSSFYDSLKHELMRTGIDENLLKYVTLGEDGNPLMPVYMNSNASKFESIVQSVFNNHITRQTLPGFHAAQVANTGWKGINEKVNGVGYCKELKYHPDKQNYIEVMVPYSFLGVNKSSEHYRQLSDEDILKELADKGLDTVIGYRIPTEGKQSACNMKIVGFVDDALGSTIIVPDEWVAQTGSDFDIDSVYAITADFYARPNGELIRYNYTKGTDRSFRSYRNKVTKEAIKADEEGSLKDTDNKYKEKIQELKDKQQEEYDELQEKESEAYNNLSDKVKDVFKELAKKVKEDTKGNNKTKQENYYHLLTNYISVGNDLLTNLNDILKDEESYTGNERDDEYIEELHGHIEVLKSFIDACTNIQDFIENQNDTYQEGKTKIREEINEEEVKKYSELGEKLGIGTFYDYQNPFNDYKYNSRHQRNTRIFELMMKILGDNASMEENLSRSNFDDLVAARNELMSDDAKTELRGRSSYNIFDQIKFQSDATSGMSLKGMSVALDTFCSVCNTAQAYTSYPLAVKYNLSSFDNFNKEAYNPSNDGLVIHNKYGWSGNNKAVNGKILTSYSHQTTAYIFDTVREGALPGVNAYTFGAFKYMANLGIDYHVSVGFMMLPGVAEIVKNQRDNVSIFNENYINPTDESIINICDRLGIYREETDNSTTLLKKVEERYGGELRAMFGIAFNDEDFTIITQSNKQIAKMVFDQQLIRDRIKGEGAFKNTGSPVEENADVNTSELNSATINQCLFDIGTILQFNFLRDVAHQTTAISQCVKPDKFGAKQTIFSTRDIFRSIDTLLYEKINMGYNKTTGHITYSKRKQKPVLYTKQFVEHVTEKGNKSVKEEQVNLLEAIYPGLDEDNYSVEDMINNLVTHDKIKDSVYPTLYAYLKYSTAISCVMAKQVFDTEKEGFVQLVDGFRSVTNDIHKPIDEAIYTDLKKYILSSMYAQCPSICQPFSMSFVNGEARFEIIRSNDPVENKRLVAEEKDRVFGYNKGEIKDTGEFDRINDIGLQISDGKLTIANVINPTDDEIRLFNTLSAGQKVQFIKRSFADSGIFGKLKVVFFNGNNRPKFTGMHSIEYTEGYESLDVARDEFKKALFNTNPLIKSAAIDLIKYAAYFEGFRMSATAINKIIDFDGLLASTEDGGIGFIQEMKELMGGIINGNGIYATQEARATLYENYLRSHPNCSAIKSITVSKYFKGKYKASVKAFDMVTFTPTGEEDYFEKLIPIGIVKSINKKDNSVIFNKYVYATVYGDKGYKKKGLYKINVINDVDPTSGNYGIVLTPLTQLLPNENSEWSSREKYNIGAISQEAYKYLLYAKPLNFNVTKKYGYNSVDLQTNRDIYLSRPEAEGKSFSQVAVYKPRNDTKRLMARKFDINELANEKGENGPTGRAIKTIQRYYIENHKVDTNLRNLRIYFVDKELGDYITNYGDTNGSIQTIDIPEVSTDEEGNEVTTYTPHKFLITKINNNAKLFSMNPFESWEGNKNGYSNISLKEALTDKNMNAIIDRIDWHNANAIKQMFINDVKAKSVDENITRVIKASNHFDQEILTTLGEMTKNKSLLEIVAMGRNLGVVEFKNLYAAEAVPDDYDINVNY